MATDISAFQTKINIIASQTFPVGFMIEQFADDADGVDFPSIQVGDVSMGVNGDLLKWSKPAPLKVTISVVPNSTDDINLSFLLQANRVGKGKIGAKDDITMTVIYPDNRFITLTKGLITDGMVGLSVASAGRFKTKTYGFAFENEVGI